MSLFCRHYIALLLFFFTVSCSKKPDEQRILVFSKTDGFRHIDAIDAGIVAIKKLGAEKGFFVDTTENADNFNEQNLQRYNAVVFLNASGEVFNEDQRLAFQRYIQAGGGFLAIHAPTDAERNWPWYGQLIGGYFLSHPADPNVQKGTYVVTGKDHPAIDSLPARFERSDEFYDFEIVNPRINVLVTIDEKSYKGGKMGEHHPAAWYHDFDGGRSFYTAMGHTTESYSDPYFLKILAGGLYYVMGNGKPLKLDYSRAVPEESRFTKHVLMEKLDEPMQMAIADNDMIYFVQRRGEIIQYDPAAAASKQIGMISVSAKYEDGLLGIALAPDFSRNKWLYVYYTAPGGAVFHISRFTLKDDGLLDNSTEKILLKIPKDILDGSHTGGGLLFDPRGNGDLYITVGDNSSPRGWGYAPIDDRPGREHWNAQRSSGNTDDLRGKILRIHPEPDGSYSIPEGNLFLKGTAGARPEIYSMGHRQPWRLSMDTKTGWLYVGEVGPDANDDSTGLGPKGYDEFNQVRQPGNFGWPYFIADNKPYWQYDFEKSRSGSTFDPAKPVNNSPANTGLKTLPPAQPAFIWYPYGASREFPLMGSGARSATGGPVFHKTDFKNAKHLFPDYYEGKLFITDWIRGWINVVSMEENGKYRSMERFMPGTVFSNPIDMQFNKDGSLIVLEYGKGWFRANDDARLVRVEYNSGNRTPVAKIAVDKKAGAVPFAVHLSSAGTLDYDRDGLTYNWKILSSAKKEVFTSDDANPSFTFKDTGVYQAVLTVTDAHGAAAKVQLELIAGNEPPSVTIDITKGNRSFFFPGASISYDVKVRDREDGDTGQAKVNIDFIPGGYKEQLGDPDPLANNDVKLYGGMVLNASDCYSCHAIDKKSVGPSFAEIAERYKDNAGAAEHLMHKVIHGGGGAWGDIAMSAHPDLSVEQVKQMVSFIQSLAVPVRPSLPVKGSYATNIPAGTEVTGDAVFLLRASYTDKGRQSVGNTVILRNPQMAPAAADLLHDVMRVAVPYLSMKLAVMYGPQPYFGYRSIDLTGIREVELAVSSGLGGGVEVHMDSVKGALIGESAPITADKGSFAPGKPVRIKLAPQHGVHDVYFVGKHPSAKRSDILFIVTGLVWRD